MGARRTSEHLCHTGCAMCDQPSCETVFCCLGTRTNVCQNVSLLHGRPAPEHPAMAHDGSNLHHVPCHRFHWCLQVLPLSRHCASCGVPTWTAPSVSWVSYIRCVSGHGATHHCGARAIRSAIHVPDHTYVGNAHCTQGAQPGCTNRWPRPLDLRRPPRRPGIDGFDPYMHC